MILNKENYVSVDNLNFDFMLLDILISDMIYIFSNSDIIICDHGLNIVDSIQITYSQQSYLEQVTMIDDKIYLFIRESKDSDFYVLNDVIGYAVKFDISGNFIEKHATIVIHDKDMIENVIIIPSAFFER